MMDDRLIFLGISWLFFLGSVFLFFSGKQRAALFLLLGGALFLFIFSALLDPFLHLWDERFHALVAKNMIHHPLIPTLYDDPVVPMDYDRWDRIHIWLHKQPLFLWPISLSLVLFGPNEFALRLPSILMGVGIVYFVFRTASNLVNTETGYFSALISACSFYLFDMIGGRIMLDHNDIAFLFYISGSLWTLSEYLITRNRWWILFTGLFSGGAILCKWLTGLLVYLIWGSYLLIARKSIKEFFPLIGALLITAVMVLPWQIYIFTAFPHEASHEMAYASKHFTTVIEGHGGDFWVYFREFPAMFGVLTPWMLIPGLLILWLWMKEKALFWAWFIITPLFV